MSFELKIGLFWATVIGIQWAIRRFPHSLPARWLMTWNGPFPTQGETRSRYYWRKTRFAIGWLLQIVAVAAVLALIAKPSPELAESDAMLISMFALSLGFGMALLGGLLVALAALKAAVLGPNPQFIAAPTPSSAADSELNPPSESPR